MTRPLVLITGGAGFIGSHTADRLLQAGYRVRILDCLDPQVHGKSGLFPAYLHPDIECLRGDVRDGEAVLRALQGISVVYHLAALTGVGQSNYDIKNYVDVNGSGTASLIETIVKHRLPVERLVLSSSRAVYGEGTHRCPEHGIVYPPIRDRSALEQGLFDIACPHCGRKASSVPTREDRPLGPISIYGWTKKLQEEQCQFAAKNFGLSVVILRYFNVYGSRQSLVNPYTGIISIFFSRLMAAKPISIYEHGIPLRDFVHVSDAAEANLKAAESDLPSAVPINIGTGIEISVLDLARALAGVVGKQLEFEDRGEFRIGDIHACVADLERAKGLLHFEPKMPLDRGLQEFVAWARQHETSDLYQRAVDELRSFGLFSQAQSERGP